MAISPYQAKRQLAWWIAQQKWVETPQGLVVTGGSLVSEDEPGNFRPGNREVDGPVAIGLQTDGGFQPFVIVQRELVRWDEESLARHESLVLLARIVAGGGFGSAGTGAVAGIDPGSRGNTSAAGYDTHGVNQVTGALRASPNGQGQSQGRDVDELLGRIAELVGETGFVDSVHGFQGRLVESGRLGAVLGIQVLESDVLVEIFNSIPSNYYPPPFRFRVSANVGGNVTLNWSLPPARFDSAYGKVQVWRSVNPGQPAPALPGPDSGPYGGFYRVGLQGMQQAFDAPGSGTWQYSVFEAYEETPSAQQANLPDRYSAPAYVTAVVP